jgi:hypothetical protein
MVKFFVTYILHMSSEGIVSGPARFICIHFHSVQLVLKTFKTFVRNFV